MATTRKKRAPRDPETPLQSLFVKRVKEELAARGWSLLTLSQRHGGPAYKTLYDAIERGSVPGMTLVYKIAVALEMQPWTLLRESDQLGRRMGDVVRLRTETPIFDTPGQQQRKSTPHRNVRK